MIVAMLLAASAVVSVPTPVEPPSVGDGSTTCWRWIMQPTAWTPVNAWVEGYWSGLNTVPGKRLVGSAMTSPALVSHVRDACAARPRETVMTAVMQAYETASLKGD